MAVSTLPKKKLDPRVEKLLRLIIEAQRARQISDGNREGSPPSQTAARAPKHLWS
jgi:hypothetical protein